MYRTEMFNILENRLKTLGKAVFGESFSYEVTVAPADANCDVTITLENVISISVYEPYENEANPDIFYWGMLSFSPGNRIDPPSEDFTQYGSCKNTGYGLDSMLKEVFQTIVEIRWQRQLDKEADAAQARFFEETEKLQEK